MKKKYVYLLSLNFIYPHLFELILMLILFNKIKDKKNEIFSSIAIFSLINIPFFFVHVLIINNLTDTSWINYMLNSFISMVSSYLLYFAFFKRYMQFF
jgi:hypothetical protein